MISPISRKDYQRVKEILADALELNPKDRLEFVENACAGNEKLQAEVESLLVVNEQEHSFPENLSALSLIQKSTSETDKFIGRKISHYRLRKEIGRGGMGVVFFAEREDFHQNVALKLIKRGMDSDMILEGFKREREILASLNHPFIAQLLDGGTTDEGTPFFVMEYVEGVSIDEYCQAKNLSGKDKLELFRRVCEAVSFAHQKLIVHRDLKPSNILVTADGTPKLLDFGIAKLLSADGNKNTQTNQRALTPAYASPEQISGGQVDTTSDVYSLGKILAELLQAEDQLKITNKTTDGELPKRTTENFQTSLAKDLQAVLQTALRSERERRYKSVEMFSADIRCYLSDLPVTARRDTWRYRAGKFVRRNKIGVAAIGLIFLSLLGGIGTTAWQWQRAERERQISQERFNDVRQLANSVLFNLHDAVENLPGSTPARKIIVDNALEYLNRLDQESNNDVSLKREIAAAYERVGKIQGNSYFSNLGDSEGAMKSYERSLEIRQKLTVDDPNNPELQEELSDSYEGVGDMFYTLGDLDQGLQNYQAALSIREKIAASKTHNLTYQASLGDIYGKIGDIEGVEGLSNLGNTQIALESFQKAVAVDRSVSEAAPDNSEYKVNYAQKLARLGNLYRTVGKTGDSITMCRKAGEIYQTLLAADPNHFSIKFSLLANNATLRYSLVDDMQYDEAISLMRQTIETLIEMQNADSKNTIVGRSLGVSYNALSQTLTQKGESVQALENSGNALKIAEELSQSDPENQEKSEDLANTLRYLADAQLHKKDYSAAASNYQRALAIQQKNFTANPTNAHVRDDIANTLAGAGMNEAAVGNPADAMMDFNQLISLNEESSQKSPVNAILRSRLALRYFQFGEIYDNAGQRLIGEKNEYRNTAKIYYQKSLDIWEQMQSENILNKEDLKHLSDCKNVKKKLEGGG